jgi:hypothetical protein
MRKSFMSKPDLIRPERQTIKTSDLPGRLLPILDMAFAAAMRRGTPLRCRFAGIKEDSPAALRFRPRRLFEMAPLLEAVALPPLPAGRRFTPVDIFFTFFST